MRYPEWSDFSSDELGYGFGGGGFGVYRIDPNSGKVTHTWPDLECARAEEIENWKKKIWGEGFEVPEQYLRGNHE